MSETDEKKKEDDKNAKIGCGFIVAVIIIIVIIGQISNNSNSNSNLSASNYSSSLGADNRKSDAWICAQKAVEDVLKSPSTAQFCSYSDATISYLGSDKYEISGYVDAENSFGATLRKDFTVTLTLTSQGFKDYNVEFE